MHMRFVSDASSLRLGPEPSGYTMAFPVPGSVAQMQSNMAATLNIDWVVDRAREAAEFLGHPSDRKTTLATLDARVLDGQAGRGALSSLHPRGRRARSLSRCQRPCPVHRPVDTHGLPGSCPCGLRGLGLRGPRLLRRNGSRARRDPRRRGRRALQSAQDHPGLRARFPRPRERSPGSRCCRCRDDGRGGRRVFPNLGDATQRWVTPLLGDLVQPDPGLSALYARAFPTYVATRVAMPPIWAELAALRSGAHA